MKQNRIKIGRWILITCAVALLYFLLSGPNSVITLFRSHRELKTIETEIRQMHKNIDSLSVQIEKLKNDTAYLEKLAREKLGMAKKDERVYKFIEEKN
ncbi:MAG: hypothetical protein GF401_15540 [Chitinivibrionales bacterium]|nr:hypothetical protein [Chitinivibrionales bacterium]